MHNISSDEYILTVHNTVYPEDSSSDIVASTVGPVQGPMCVDRSGWKSSQAIYTSGVFGPIGAKVTVSKQGLDWSGVGGAILEEGETCSSMWEGESYCPGEELPRYYDREYKPRCSKWRRTHLDVPKEVEAIVMDKEKDTVDRVPIPGRNINNIMAKVCVQEMVGEWNVKIAMEAGEGEHIFGVKHPRRVSRDFRSLVEEFEELGQSGKREGARTLVDKQTGANLPFGKYKFESFTDIESRNILLGKNRKYSTIRNKKVCVVREGLYPLLANSSTNRKRVRADGEEIEDILLPGGKRSKVTPL